MTVPAGSYLGPAWWPLRLLRELPRQRRLRTVAALWVAASALAIALALLEVHYGWSGLPFEIAGVSLAITIYPPLLITVLLTIWIGPMWGIVPAFLATFVSALYSGMSPPLAALFATATPVELAILWGSLVLLDIHPDLPRWRDHLLFTGAVVVAVSASSLAGLIWSDARGLDIVAGQRIWQGWVIGDFVQLGVLLPLALKLGGPRARGWVDRQFVVPPRHSISYRRSVMLLIGIVAVLALVVAQGVTMIVRSLHDADLVVSPRGELLLARLGEILLFMGLLLAVALTTTIAFAWVLARTGERERNVALRDPLTGCFNRRAFYPLFQKEADRSKRLGRGVALIHFDVDHFKRVNDTYGHEIGDQVLLQLARRVSGVIREHDLLFRWGGEEFLVLLPHTGPGDAAQLAERIRSSIAAWPLVREQVPTPVQITVSLGAVGALRLPIDPDELIGLADVACYLAKQRGRNQVVTEAAETAEWAQQAD